ncbi:MAG TPA: hypothetical protein VLJ60_09420 [bacterium]|nr:hypothetical protein [bacterium]
MKKKILIIFCLISVWSFISGQSITGFYVVTDNATGYEDEDEDEEEETASENEDEFAAEKEEEDPFMKKEKKVEDDFVPDDLKDEGVKKDVFVQPIDDDFVVEKREKGKTHRYVEPDLAKIVVPTYLYAENSIRSKKLFELYRNDEVVILEESGDFMKVEFLGKEGWVPIQDVRIEKWHTFRISMELSGGVAGGGGEIKNFDVIGNYVFRLNVAVVQDFVVGVEGRGLSFDTDVLYAGGGLMLRYYIHGVRSKKTRSALSAYAGYLGGYEKKGDSYGLGIGESEYTVFNGVYAGGSLDYYFRVWNWVSLGIGGDFTFVKLYGETETAKLEKEFYQGGGHLSIMFNILR